MPGGSDSEPVALDLRDHVAFDLDTPQLRPITAGAGLRLDLVCLEPGQVLPAATLDGDRLYTVIGGLAWAVVENAEVVLQPLQALLVPAGAAHGLRNDSPDPLIVQVVTVTARGGSAAADAPASIPLRRPADAEAASADPMDPMDPTEGSPPGGSARQRASRPDRFARIRRLLGSQE